MMYIPNVLLNLRVQTFEKSAYKFVIDLNYFLSTQTNSLSQYTVNEPSLLTG